MIEVTSFIWILTLISSFVICAISIKFTIPILKKLNTIDMPNKRSSHIKPTPKGAGIAIIFALFLLQFIFSIKLHAIFIICILILTFISFINDYKQLSAIFRFLVQGLIIYIFLYIWPPVQNINIFNNLIPIWFEKIILYIAFLWFINLFNFMDGIDGITGIQSCIISLGTVISLTVVGQISNLEFFLCAFITGSSIAFLFWNWHPAKIFLGDAGSIPIGFINFVLILILCKNNLWYIALMLNIYYISDTTYTLLKRIRMKKKPWEAHNEHFYQLPIQRNVKHSTVSLAILAHGIFMIGLSIASLVFTSITFIIFMIMIAGLSTVYLLYYFKYKL